QDRVGGVRFDRALFTNLTQDHLDFHGNFEEYFAAKKKLFTEYLAQDGVGIVNIDSEYGRRLLDEWNGARVTFSRGETVEGFVSREGRPADLVLLAQELSLDGTLLVLSWRNESFTL